ncbi:hypothetical protein [Adhaeretor mobilis]|uniref:hypothetical protein n=1 Tax=Adhaeretor mobilis TaxID=1930276 RepID=UPI0011A97660|nr:hypothetical protein [Adhaeretor mobilis]
MNGWHACSGAVSFSVITGQMEAHAGAEFDSALVDDYLSDSVGANNFVGGATDRAAASVIPSLSGNLFEFSASSISLTTKLSDPPNTPRASSSATFDQAFTTNAIHRLTLIADVDQAVNGTAGLEVANVHAGSTTLVTFGPTPGDVESYRSFIIGPGSYVLRGFATSAAFSPGNSSGAFSGTLAVSPLADVNGDAIVDGEDLDIWQETYGGFPTGSAPIGDFNSDFSINGADFLLWQRERDSTIVSNQIATMAVPSPSSALLALWGFAFLLGNGRRSRKNY